MRFEILVNGKRVCLAGIPGYGVLTATLSWVKRNPASVDRTTIKTSSLESFLKELIELEVGGLNTNADAGEHGQRLNWLKQHLREGDEIAFRVLPPGRSDEPKRNRKRRSGT